MRDLEQISIRLVKGQPLISDKQIHSPKDAVALIGTELCQMDREVLCVLNLRTDGRPINFSIVSIGTVNQCLAEPREIFKSSILSNAASMVLLHNPSGTLTPSKSDSVLTDRMIRLCNLMGIELLDHIIVGGDNSKYFSFKEKEILPNISNQLTDDYQQIDFQEKAVAETVETLTPVRHHHR